MTAVILDHLLEALAVRQNRFLTHFDRDFSKRVSDPLLQLLNSRWLGLVYFRLHKAPQEEVARSEVRRTRWPRHVGGTAPHPSLRHLLVEPNAHRNAPVWRRAVVHEKDRVGPPLRFYGRPEFLLEHLLVVFFGDAGVEEKRSVDAELPFCRPGGGTWRVQ